MTRFLRRPVRWDDRWVRAAIAASVLVVIGVLTLPWTLTPGLRTRLTDALSERFASKVDVKELRVSVLPHLRVAGEGVVLRHQGRTDVPPLITVASFSAEASLLGLLGRPLRLKRVYLHGLEINIPAGGVALKEIQSDGDADGRAPEQAGDSGPPRKQSSPIIIDDLLSERAVLRLLRDSPGRRPRVFEIAHLSMKNTGGDTPWAFSANLTNPTPPGDIETAGTFGPWNASKPAATPLEGRYDFRDADLGVFGGIRGVLVSQGRFKGVLERIEVEGKADVPDFALDDVGQPVPLSTAFHAIVDGTNGNTWLRPVKARLQDSPIGAEGGIVERENEQGRTVRLDVTMTGARIEDVLRLAVKSAQPHMTGALDVKTSFVLPPGRRSAIEKMRLAGSFALKKAEFAKGEVQNKVNELSQRARGEPEGPADRVVSDFKGRFVMDEGVIRFSEVTFVIPGARVDVNGRYTVRSEALDFRGTIQLEAKLSELTTGVKSFLLKMVDPLMRRKDVTVIPVTIGGTAGKPSFGLDLKRAITRRLSD